MPLDALPSGKASRGLAALPASWASTYVPPVSAVRAAVPCERNRRRVNIALFLSSAFRCNGGVVLLEQVVVLAHELLAGILVHFLPQGFREMAPHILVHVGDLVEPTPFTNATHPRPVGGSCLLL